MPFVLPGEEDLEWRLVMDTAEEESFIDDGPKFESGDDLDVEGRSLKLLRLTAGSQAKARHESWKKRRPVDVPRKRTPGSHGAGRSARARRKPKAPRLGRRLAGRPRDATGPAVIFRSRRTVVDSNDLHVELGERSSISGKSSRASGCTGRSAKAATNTCRSF
jgi:hypothetical protein